MSKKNYSTIKAVIFDFDGVICESVDVKTQAFRRLFAGYPDQMDKIIRYHLVHGGISRFEKFKAIYRDILKEDLSEAQSLDLGRRFSEYVLEGVVNSEYVDGAREFLDKYHKRLMLFVASGTPEDELKIITRRRGLDGFFCGIFGSPRTKPQIIAQILRDFRLKAPEIIFVGDALSDYHAAKSASVRFIGMVDPQGPNLFENIELKEKVSDIFGLERMLVKECAA